MIKRKRENVSVWLSSWHEYIDQYRKAIARSWREERGGGDVAQMRKVFLYCSSRTQAVRYKKKRRRWKQEEQQRLNENRRQDRTKNSVVLLRWGQRCPLFMAQIAICIRISWWSGRWQTLIMIHNLRLMTSTDEIKWTRRMMIHCVTPL